MRDNQMKILDELTLPLLSDFVFLTVNCKTDFFNLKMENLLLTNEEKML